MICNRWLVVAAVAALAAAPSRAAYREEVLPNGLRVVLVEHRANPMVCSSMIVGAGVVDEPEGLNGASHFLEHLLFNGTTTRTQRELYDDVDRYGAYNNATTREDHTLFTLLIQKEFVAKGLEIQADMLFRSTFPPDKFEKEKGIVLEELARDRNDPDYLAGEAFRTFAYAGTPLARPVLGSEASIKGMSRDAVLAYYRARYVPGNMVLVVMGDFEAPRMLEEVKRTFGAAPKGRVPPPVNAAWPAPPARNLATRPLDAGRSYLYAALPLPIEPYDPRMGSVELLLAALSSGKDAPLSVAFTSGADPLVQSFSLSASPRAHGWSTIEFEAVLAKGREPGPVLQALAGGLRSLEPGGLAWDRISLARTARRADEALTADNIQYYAMTRSAYLLGSPRDDLAQRLGIGPPPAEPIAEAAAAIRSALPSLRAAASGPGWTEEATAWAPAAPLPAAATRGEASETFPSGLRAWAARNGDSQVFAVHLALAPRSASEPPGKEGIADFLHRMLLRGTLIRDAAALSSALDALGARIKLVDDPAIPYDDYYTTPEFSFVRLEAPAERWREAIALLAEIVRYPRLAVDDVEAVRREMLDLQKRQSESTRAVAQDLVARTLEPGHPLSKPVLGNPASIASVTVDDLRAFHREYVSGKRIVLTAVGPVDPGEVLAAARHAFGDLPSGPEPPQVPPPPVTPAGLAADAAVGKGMAQIVLARLFDADPSEDGALAVAGVMLSDRLSFHLREEKGLAYAMSASMGPLAGRTKLEVTMGTRQANAEEALRGLREGIAEFAAAAPDPEKVERAVNALRGRLLMRRMTRINQAYFAALDLMGGRTAGDARKRLDALRQVRAEDVARVARKYLDPGACATLMVR
jgi:zinc protease